MKRVKNIVMVFVLLVVSTKGWGQLVVPVDTGKYAINVTSISIRVSERSERVSYSFLADNGVFHSMSIIDGTASGAIRCDNIAPNEDRSTNGHITSNTTGYINAITRSDIKIESTLGWHQGSVCINYLWDYPKANITLTGKTPYYSSILSTILGHLTATYRLDIKPAEFNLHRPSEYITYRDTFQLMASRGFENSAYVWKYKFDNQYGTFTTRTFGSAFNNNDTISFRGADILTESEMNYLIRNNKKIEVFIDYQNVPCTSILLTPVLSAPYITASYEPETCNGSQDAKILVHLDRPLIEEFDERLVFTVNDAPTHQIEIINDTTIMLVPSNGFGIIYDGYPTGTYNIEMFGYCTINSIYGVTYTDSRRHSTAVTIYERPKVILPVPTIQNISCYGGNNGKIFITPQGGVGKYTVYLQNSNNDTIDILTDLIEDTTYSFSGLFPDTYKVSIVDTNLCSQAESAKTITLTEPTAPLAIEDITITPLTGYETGNGIIQAIVSGGYGRYKVWLKQGENIIHTQQLDEDIFYLENLDAGIYTLLFRDTVFDIAYGDDASLNNINGCFIDSIIEITQPDPLIVDIEQTNEILCFGDSAATLVAHAIGGVQFSFPNLPYNYKWFAVGNEDVVLSADSVVNGLPAGDYQVLVTDRNNNFTYSDTFSVQQPTLLVVEYVVLNQIFCAGDSTGKIQAIASGGTPPYIYHWYPSGKTAAIIDSIFDRAEIAYIEDSNGCRTEDFEIIVANTQSLFARATEILNPSCYGYSDGAISVEILGGTPPYSFEWNDGITTQSRENLTEGVYSISVTDAENCFFKQTFTIIQPDEIKFPKLPYELVLCKDQSFVLNAELDMSNVNYSWTNNDVVISTEPYLEVNQGGVYKINAITEDNCTAQQEINVTQSDTELKIAFAIATKVPKHKTINAVNITQTPTDSVKWSVPNNAFIISETDDLLQLRFNSNGEYQVSLAGYSEFCTDIETKTILVVDDIEIEHTEQTEEPFLKQFMVAPNPNNGSFEVFVQLREMSDYQLIIYNDKGITMTTREIAGTDGETTSFNENLPLGVYILRFVSTKTISTIKLIINN